MGPLYPKTLRAHGYAAELDAPLAANADTDEPRLPAEAVRLARDVLLFGTYDQAPQRCRSWFEHADELSLVAPFGFPARHIYDIIEAVSAPRAALAAASGQTTL